MLLDHCYAFGLSLLPSSLKKKFVEEGTPPLTYFCPANDPPLDGSGQTRAPRGTDRSPEYNEHFCYKLDSRVKN